MSDLSAWVKYEDLGDNSGQFELQPLDKGMGNTIGNSIRRVLLSSLSGAGITDVFIKGASHEFSTLPNVVEDTLDIIFNLKGLIFRYDGEDPCELTLKASGKKIVTGKDIKAPGTITILNLDHHIAQLADKGELDVKFYVVKGKGFVLADSRPHDDELVNAISLDTSFSPIVKVNYRVETMRVGKDLDHDKLVLTVWTNGSVSPKEAVEQASSIIVEQMNLFNKINQKPELKSESSSAPKLSDPNHEAVMALSIDDLELSARSSNCLKRAGIDTVGSLFEKDMTELIKIKNFGKKSADEINEKLKQYNIALRDI